MSPQSPGSTASAGSTATEPSEVTWHPDGVTAEGPGIEDFLADFPPEQPLPELGALVEVRWIDAVTINAWTSLGSLPDPAPVDTVGWLVKMNSKAVWLAASIGADQDDDHNAITVIPWGMFQHLRVIE